MTPTVAAARDPLRVYVRVVCAIVFIGESVVLATTDKFLPQGMDEFAFVAVMLALTARPLTAARLGLMFGAWCFLFGSLYTMLFARLDPHGGSGDRLGGLIVLMAACLIGAAWTLWRRWGRAAYGSPR